MQAGLVYTTLPSLWEYYKTFPRQLAFHARSVEEWRRWREALYRRLVDLLGGFPLERPPLQATVLASKDETDYRWEKVAFQSEPDLYVPCYVLIPHRSSPPYRPVIALHGHGSGGAAHVVGLIVDEANRAAEEVHIRKHNYDYGRQLAQHGFMVFVPEQRGFGERMEAGPDMVQGDPMWLSSCRALVFNAILLGKTAIGLRVWDVMRTLDYIRSRPEATVSGVGCLGLSGGGTTTLFAAALDPRITVAVVSGYFNTFRASIMARRHCECNYIPRILQYAEMSDIAGLIAPRPLLVESGTEDDDFPVEGARSAYRELQRIYEALNAPERLDIDVFPGGHQFSGRKAFDWLDRWLP